MSTVPVHYLLLFSAGLLTIGLIGIVLNRRNLILILMSIELILLAVGVNFVAFATETGDIAGIVFALVILAVAAAEASIGLAILVVYFRNHNSVEIDEAINLRG